MAKRAKLKAAVAKPPPETPKPEPKYLHEPDLGIRRQVAWLLKDVEALLPPGQVADLATLGPALVSGVQSLLEARNAKDRRAGVRAYKELMALAHRAQDARLRYGQAAMAAFAEEASALASKDQAALTSASMEQRLQELLSLARQEAERRLAEG